MDLAVEGRHALLFDDDAVAAFVNSRDALVPWSGDPALLMDRYDARHLLDRIPPRPPRRVSVHLSEEPAGDGVTAAQIDHERYFDLPPFDDADDNEDGDARKGSPDTINAPNDTYQSVSFSYGNSESATDRNKSDYGTTYSGYRPPFPIPERLLRNLPSSEKLHQIIARTAMFVSQHGGQSEIVLRVKQGDNPTFGFLMPDNHLHEYFRFLVDHPQHLKSDATIYELQEKEKLDYRSDNMPSAGSGALSLLESVYGSTEDDDGTYQPEVSTIGSGNSITAAILPISHTPERSYKVLEGKAEIKSLNASVASKDKTISTKKKLPVKSALVNASFSKKSRDGDATIPGSYKGQGFSQFGTSDVKQVFLEPPLLIKRMIDKIVEFIIRNGEEFEAVLIEQDKSVGRFPFLLPSNQYHPYYLNVLEGAYQGNAAIKKKGQADSEEPATHHSSSDLSEGLLCDPRRKEKFKMVIGSKKEKHGQPALVTQSGVSVDEAAAIVLAATRGVSPANARQHASPPEVAAGPSMGDVKRGFTTGSFSLKSQNSPSKPAPFNEAGKILSFSGQQPSERSSGPADDVWIAKAIAKTAALVASCEADSSEASLTKEQKLKAERLKRAKMFTAMIKSGNPSNKMTSLATVQNSSMDVSTTAGSSRSGAGSDVVLKEREGSSLPLGTVVSDQLIFHGDVSDKEVSRKYNYTEKHPLSSYDLHHEVFDGIHENSKKGRQSDHSAHHNAHDDRKRRKCHSSSREKESRHHYKNHGSPDDQYKHRKRSRDHRHEKSEDEDREKKLPDRHRKKHHLRSIRNHDAGGETYAKIFDQSVDCQTLSISEQELKMTTISNAQPAATSQVSRDLREKIRAMLLESL